MLRMTCYAVLLLLMMLIMMGCGTENPFDRGPMYDDGTSEEPGPVGQMSFATDIIPILSQCTGCHAGGSGGWTYDGGPDAYAQALSVVDADTPEDSPLLLKGAGIEGHGGGVVFSPSSTDYEAILAWIQDGAPDN